MGYLIKDGVQFFGNNSVSLTQAQYDALVATGAVDPASVYYITDRNNPYSIAASRFKYDNTNSGIVSTNVQSAIDGTVDDITGDLPATKVNYDNTSSGIVSTNVQSAVDEIVNRIYPVGSIYVSVTDSSVNQVEARFGGTWETFATGKTLIGVDSTDVDFNVGEKTGGSKTTSYTPAGNNSGTSVTMNAVTLTHSGGAVQSHTLVESELPKISGSWYIHGQESGTIFYNAYGHCTGTKINNTYKPTTAISGAYSLQNPGFSFGGGGGHDHGFTQPAQHSFTPSVSTVTNPKFTGTQAAISVIQPYITVYMYKRTA